MKDAELSPSEDESRDIDETAQLGDEKAQHSLKDAPVIAELHMNRMLDPDVAWVCIGYDRKMQGVRLLVLDGDWLNPMELTGFIHSYCRPDIIIPQINQGGGDDGQQK